MRRLSYQSDHAKRASQEDSLAKPAQLSREREAAPTPDELFGNHHSKPDSHARSGYAATGYREGLDMEYRGACDIGGHPERSGR
jgi:hypothetical protein